MANIKSTAVKVFPSAFRGPSSGTTKYNPESRLNTEFNVTNLTNRLASRDSFVIDWNSGTKIIKFNIHGYYFEANLTEFLGVGGTGASWTDVYASIKVIPFITDEGEPSAPNTKYKGFTLVGANDTVGFITEPSGRILDVDTGGTYFFEGLDLTQTPRTPASDVYELKILSGGPSSWAVPLTSLLKFEATDVEGLPKINDDLTLNTSDTVFAPITAGTSSQVLVSAGGTSAPVWANQSTVVAGQAEQLTTARTLWGQSFDGTANIDGTIENTNSITPKLNNVSSVGSSSKVYANVYATHFIGDLTGNADTVTNGVYTSGNQTIAGTKTFSSTISGSIDGNSATVTNGVYTNGSYSDPSWLTISKSKVGLGNVDNTSDANKPISDATQDALDLKAPLASPAFTGTVTGITASMVGAEPANANIQSHISSTSNPHGVTTAQIGAEPANANIQSHISSTSNPHSVTKTQVGLGNVTNDAQVKKLSASTSGNVPTWNGISGNALNNGYTVQTTLSSSTTALVRADAIQTALDLKADLASPNFTGNPTATTQASSNNSTRIATTAFVQTATTPTRELIGVLYSTASNAKNDTGAILNLSSAGLSKNWTEYKYILIQAVSASNSPNLRYGTALIPVSEILSLLGVGGVTKTYTVMASRDTYQTIFSVLMIEVRFTSGDETSVRVWFSYSNSNDDRVQIIGIN
jgi:hypothetical protein